MGILDSVVEIGTLGLVDDFTGSEAAQDAALRGNQMGIDAMTRMFDRSVELNEPFREIGLRNLEALEGEVSGYTPESRLDAIRNAFASSNEMENLLKTGFDQVQGSAAARGSLFSGNTLKGLEDYRQRTFGDFANQYNALADNRLNRLAALGGIGQAATGNLTALNQQQGQNLSNAFMNQGNIQAAGAMADFNNLLNIGNMVGSFYG